MKSRLLLSAAFVFVLAACSAEEEAGVSDPEAGIDVAALQEEARGVAKMFGGALKGELQAAMMADGPVAAIEVCNVRAPEIAAASGEASGWAVGRTSERLRNPANGADSWEAEQLTGFAARAAAGEDLNAMEVSKVFALSDGTRSFRYMKAIPTGDVCTICHGVELAPEIAERLDALYPEDAARGYEAGQLRGAFTLMKALP